MKKVIIFASSIVVVFLSGCATQLDTSAEKVRLVTATQKESCESLGIISTDQQLGLNKASNAMNKAINEVARRGGNAVFVVSTGTSGLDGAAVTAEALRCKGG
jgi:protein involved in sex pheromone biosynthesis